MNIVIMAGGGGTRLWPVSREKFPKQFAALTGRRTLLQLAFARALAVTRHPRNIAVTTRAVYAPEVRRQLPRLPARNLLVEPARRDTAPAVGLAAAFFAAEGKHDEPLLQLASDHLVRHESRFRLALRAQALLLREHADWTVLLGEAPTYPETGFGYIEQGIRVGRTLGLPVYAVRRFREKPTLSTARRFLRAGRYFWNMSIYAWRVGTLLELFHRHQPVIARRLDHLIGLFRDRAPQRARDRVFVGMPSISLDYAITEVQDRGTLFFLPGDYGWSDVGHWASLAEVLGGGTGTVVRGGGTVVEVSGRRNFVYSDSPGVIGLVGVQNLIVVSTKDAVLVADKANAQDVKKLVAELRQRGHRRVL